MRERRQRERQRMCVCVCVSGKCKDHKQTHARLNNNNNNNIRTIRDHVSPYWRQESLGKGGFLLKAKRIAFVCGLFLFQPVGTSGGRRREGNIGHAFFYQAIGAADCSFGCHHCHL